MFYAAAYIDTWQTAKGPKTERIDALGRVVDSTTNVLVGSVQAAMSTIMRTMASPSTMFFSWLSREIHLDCSSSSSESAPCSKPAPNSAGENSPICGGLGDELAYITLHGLR